MSQEVYEMITRLDRERIETHLVVQCAPMISGMKVSNLLNVEKKLAPQMKQVLERSGISYYLLLESEDKATFLVYREDCRWKTDFQNRKHFCLFKTESFKINLNQLSLAG